MDIENVDDWEDMLTNVGGQKRERRAAVNGHLKEVGYLPGEGDSRLEDFFEAQIDQWSAYDLTILLPNVIRPGTDAEAARAETNREALRYVRIITENISHMYSGTEPFVLPRDIGAGLFVPSTCFQMADAQGLEEVVEIILSETPVMVPGIKVLPGERRIGVIGVGNEDLLQALNNRIVSHLDPIMHGWSFGGDPKSASAEAFMLINLTGPELKRVLSIEGPPPPYITRFLQRVKERWDRIGGGVPEHTDNTDREGEER